MGLPFTIVLCNRQCLASGLFLFHSGPIESPLRVHPPASERRRMSDEFDTASTVPLPMLVMPPSSQAPTLSAQAIDPYLKRIHVNSVDVHRLNDRQNLEPCADDTVLTSQFNITALRTLLLYLLYPGCLKRADSQKVH